MAMKFDGGRSSVTKKKPAQTTSELLRTPIKRQADAYRAPMKSAGGSYGKGLGVNKPAPATPAGGGGGGGGGGSYAPRGSGAYTTGAAGMTAAPASAPPRDEDYLAGDAAYLAQIAALKKAFEDFGAEQTAGITKYNVDFNDSLKNLGWQTQLAADGMGKFDPSKGAWNETDANTASGRAFSNQLNDYASRGILQSSLFGTARDDLSRSLNDQLTSVVGGRQTYLDDLSRQKAQYQNENTLSQQQARAEALQRRAAQYGV